MLWLEYLTLCMHVRACICATFLLKLSEILDHPEEMNYSHAQNKMKHLYSLFGFPLVAGFLIYDVIKLG